jgi:hypothetical protein
MCFAPSIRAASITSSGISRKTPSST